MERLLSAASFYSLIFLFIMFTASQLLDKINNHISEIQFTRTPKGLYEPIEYRMLRLYTILPLRLKFTTITPCCMMI